MAEEIKFRRAAIVGVGLIGSSLAWAMRGRGLADEIVGVDRDADVIARAQKLGVIDGGETDLAKGVQGADLVVVSTPVDHGMMSWRTFSAITTSSSAVLPARSPSPLIVHSIWRAPPATAASEFAVAIPRSLWQCVAKITSSAPGTSAISWRIRSALSTGAV